MRDVELRLRSLELAGGDLNSAKQIYEWLKKASQ